MSYVRSDLPIFRTNPLVFFIFFIELFIGCIFFYNPYFLIALFIFFLSIAYNSKIGKDLMGLVKYSFYIATIILIFNVLFNRNGSTILFKSKFSFPIFGPFILTLESLIFSLISALSIVTIMYLYGIFNRIMNPDDLMKVFEKLRLPYSLNFILTVSIRFFPVILSDAEKISDVQKSRGYELDRGNFLSKIRNRIILILPLLTNSLDRSIQMSEALEARGFGLSKKRTQYKSIKTSKFDKFILFLTFILMFMNLFFGFKGFGDYTPYPIFTTFALTIQEIVYLVILISSNIIIYLLIINHNKLKDKLIDESKDKSKEVKNLD